MTHHDFHEHNIGTVDHEVVFIDWAYIGWGPIGHDAGDLAEVRRSMRVSNQLRMSWSIDYLLDQAHLAPDSTITAASQSLTFLYDLD